MAKSVNIRELVLDMLMAVNEDRTPSHYILGMAQEKYQYLPARDRHFMARLYRGTLERRITLDWVLNRYSKTPVERMRPLVRNALRMSLYQILYMDQVPDRAAISEGVEMVRRRRLSGLTGFVNGVLRRISAEKDSLVWPDAEADPVLSASVTLSLPQWLVRLWLDTYGEETLRQMGEALLAPSPLTVRAVDEAHPERVWQALEAEGVECVPCRHISYARQLRQVDRLTELAAFKAGLFVVQDEASMMVAEWAGIRPGDAVLDVCAAPGGKSLHAFSKGAGHVYARDLTEEKLERMRENIARIPGASEVIDVSLQDARQPRPEDEAAYDVVFADLPCSGLGVMGRKPDIRWRMDPDKVSELVRLQRDILSVVWRCVRPGGVLIYSTCTVSPAENQQNTAWLVSSCPFECTMERQFLPGADGCDGFYLARLVRR